ncbi:MAG: RNA-dependent DNA polymerase [Lachnospiraceae bacterium]|nr:RNA-dependent DNA polymerase [Lachnospiraceae bacterium]
MNTDSTRRPNYIENAWNEICSYQSLVKAHENARKGKRYRPEVLGFTARLEDYLIEIQEKMIDGTYELGPYRKKWIIIPKKRLVMALPYMDRIVQWSIYQYINPIFDKLMIEDSYACREGKGSHKASHKLQYWMRKVRRKTGGEWYYLKLDISKFFYRVNHEILIRILEKRIKDTEFMNFLKNIINSRVEPFGLPPGKSPQEVPQEEWLYDVGMPIGNLTSQLFANIYLNELDQYCKHKLKIHYYIRYMDDIVILGSSKEELKGLLEDIRRYLNEELRLDLNKKTCIRPIRCGVEFVGLKITAQRIRLRKSTTKRIKKEVKGICERYADGRMGEGAFKRRAASISGLLSHADTRKLRDRLNELYSKAMEKRTGTSKDERYSGIGGQSE